MGKLIKIPVIMGIIGSHGVALGSEFFCCMHDYIITTEVDSKIIRGLKVDGPEKFRCPRCDKIHDGVPKHGELWECDKCKLQLRPFGNTIELIK